MDRLKTVIFYVLMVFFLFWTDGKAASQSSFAKGEELFMQNKPAEALEFLETATAEDPAHIQAFLYLGIVYQQLDRLDEAIAVYRRILPKGGKETARIAYNLGNAYFSKGNAEFARQYYTQALDSDPSWAPAFLNRANAQIKTGALTEAVADYEQYLDLVPYSEKRPRIEALIAFIREEFAEQDRRRIQAEEAARAEAERRKRLLEEVSASLQAAAEDSKGLSAGIENVQGYEGEFELE
ncbi:MAG: tetratricopeptide repeat protein [Treponema sp.]|nr:tetratricopeptide repeat protein [Treponema sp.]